MTAAGGGTLRTVVRLVRRAVSYELGLWRSLYRWVFRRPPALDGDARTFGYTGAVALLFWVFIGVSAVEIPVAHVILPWEIAQRISLVIGFYGLLWMVGLLASLYVHPHVVDDAGLRLRYGTSVDISVPWEAVATVRSRRRTAPSGRGLQLEDTDSGTIAHLGMSSQTSVDVVLSRPTKVPLPKGASEPVTELRFYADDPDALVACAREHLTAHVSGSDK